MLHVYFEVEAKEQQQRALSEAIQQCEAAVARSAALSAELTSFKQHTATADSRHETESQARDRSNGNYVLGCYSICAV
jgi:anti-sigma factor RsiW